MSAERLKWDGTRIPPERWGRDHLSTLLYVETLVVDHRGRPDPRRIRTKVGGAPLGDLPVQPTRLIDGAELYGHDDWDCIDDMVESGLVVWGGTGANPVFGLTDKGWQTAHRLRRHLGEGTSANRTLKGFVVVQEDS